MSSISAAFQSPTTSSRAIAAQRFAQAAQTSPAAQPNTGGYAAQDGFTKNDSNSKISKMLGQTAMTPSDLQAAFQGAGTGSGLYIIDATDPSNPILANQLSTSQVGSMSPGVVFAVGTRGAPRLVAAAVAAALLCGMPCLLPKILALF